MSSPIKTAAAKSLSGLALAGVAVTGLATPAFAADPPSPVTVEDPALQKCVDEMYERGGPRELQCFDKGVTSLVGLEQVKDLKAASLGKNSISNYGPLSSLNQLGSLSLTATSDADLSPLNGLTKLTNLMLDGDGAGGRFSDLDPLASLTNLTKLYVSSASDPDASALSSLTKLESLTIMSCRLDNAAPLTSIGFIESMSSLKRLHIGCSSVSDVSPVLKTTSLEELHAYNGHISDVSMLSQHPKLAYVDFSQNSISDISSLAVIKDRTWGHDNAGGPSDAFLNVRSQDIGPGDWQDPNGYDNLYSRIANTGEEAFDWPVGLDGEFVELESIERLGYEDYRASDAYERRGGKFVFTAPGKYVVSFDSSLGDLGTPDNDSQTVGKYAGSASFTVKDSGGVQPPVDPEKPEKPEPETPEPTPPIDPVDPEKPGTTPPTDEGTDDEQEQPGEKPGAGEKGQQPADPTDSQGTSGENLANTASQHTGLIGMAATGALGLAAAGMAIIRPRPPPHTATNPPPRGRPLPGAPRPIRREQGGALASPAKGETVSTDPIRTFSKEFRFLSNFWSAEVILDGERYPTVEHAYQAAKRLEPEYRARIRTLERAGQAKRAGQAVTPHDEWLNVRVQTMLQLTRQKYRHPDLARKLLATGDRSLFEGNDWHDTFWGRCLCDEHRGAGDNVLGSMLMLVRSSLRADLTRTAPITIDWNKD
ncbi:NADAR domain-containing protein [Leucobacter sp. HY1910]